MELSDELDVTSPSSSPSSEEVGTDGIEVEKRGRRRRVSSKGDEQMTTLELEGGSVLRSWSIIGILVGLQVGAIALSRRSQAKRIVE